MLPCCGACKQRFVITAKLTASQLVSSGRQPRLAGSKYTMPQRLTVAGDATARSPTSNIMDIVGDIAMISELGRHSFLLSSSTAPERHAAGKQQVLSDYLVSRAT